MLLEAHRRKERGTDAAVGFVGTHGRLDTAEQIGDLEVVPLESLNDIVLGITGVSVRETIPDRVLGQAEQIELLDMAPEALIQRMKHGNIYPPEQARRAPENFFTGGNLTALRATAKGVEDTLSRCMRDEGGVSAAIAAVADRILVAVDHRPIGKALVRRGWHIASALKGELMVTYVEPERGPRAAQTVEDERQLRANHALADELGARVVRLRGKVADELVAWARANKVTHLIIGQSTRGRWGEMLGGSVTHDLLRNARGIDVLVVAEPEAPHKERSDHPPG